MVNTGGHLAAVRESPDFGQKIYPFRSPGIFTSRSGKILGWEIHSLLILIYIIS